VIRLPSMRVPLPLLAKELTEQAARPRTYILRVVYAALLFIVYAFVYYQSLGSWHATGALLGRGSEMFAVVSMCQAYGVFLFLPAIMATAITHEKEHRTLPLLFITALRPHEIVLQKYFGRLIPMFTLLLLSMPLLAISYAFGGIEPLYLLMSAGWLFVSCLFVGAVSIACSAYCRTSVSAFIASYLVTIGVTIALQIVFAFAMLFSSVLGIASYLVVSLTVYLGTIVLLLLLATRYLVRRGSLPPDVSHRRRALRRIWQRRKRKGRHAGDLPERKPVAWREGTCRCSEALRHPGRTFTVIFLVVLLPGMLIAGLAEAGFASALAATLLFLMWIVAALAVLVSSASAIPVERTSQTLDVLLTTPLSGREILHGKLEGVRRLMLVLAAPLVALIVLKSFAELGYRHPDFAGVTASLFHFAGSVLALFLGLPLVSWVAVWVSLKVRTRYRAVLCALGAVVAWCVLPWMGVGILETFDVAEWRQLGAVAGLSPATLVVMSALAGYDNYLEFGSPVALITSFVACGVALYAVREVCLRNADRYLGRARPGDARRAVPSLEGTAP